jgi:hypothetical protein
MVTLCLHPNLLIDTDRGWPLPEALVGAFDEPRADALVIKEDAGLPQERRKTRRVGKVLLKLLMPPIANVGQTIGDPYDFVAISLSFDKGDKIDVAVSRNRASHAGSYEDHADEIASAAATHMTHSEADKLFEPRFVDGVRLFWRFRHRQEFRLQFF